MNADFAQLIATGEMHVLEHAGEIVGVIRLRAEPPALWVENVAVDPRFQHQGYGRQLLAFADQQARAAGLSELRLYANELMLENIALYARLGYVETERQLHGDFHRVFMRKPLA
jgi:ribosomal protein S18 acetylase RimI-like enzyme